jgi:hypothetical protein
MPNFAMTVPFLSQAFAGIELYFTLSAFKPERRTRSSLELWQASARPEPETDDHEENRL